MPDTDEQLWSDRMERNLKNWEGLRLTAYFDSVGEPTIGYGHTETVDREDVMREKRITRQRAEELLERDLRGFQETLVGNLPCFAELEQRQIDAVLHFTYNVGAGWAVEGNGVGINTRAAYEHGCATGDWSRFVQMMLQWDHPAALAVRRREEKAMFNRGVYLRA